MGNLKDKRILHKYSCSQEDLESVVKEGVNSYQLNRQKFYEKSTRYTEQWGDDLLAEMNAAYLMPDYAERETLHKNLRVVTTGYGAICCELSKELEGHIFKSFAEELQKNLCEEAGSTHYKDATEDDWEAVEMLMRAGSLFITKYQTELLAGGMPVSFEDNFSTAALNFETSHHNFLSMEQTTKEMSEDKIRAYNMVYKKLMDMFKDGQKIFRHDAATRERFTFSKVLDYVRHQQNSFIQKVLKLIINLLVPNTLELGIRGKGVLNILYGDGAKELFTMNPDATNFSNHIYQLIKKSITVQIKGDLDGITEFHCNNSRLMSFGILKLMVNLKMLVLQNNMMEEKEVNKLLITLDKMKMSNMIVNILGNAAPTGDGIIAKNNLVGRGCTVLTS